MQASAIILEQPERVALDVLAIDAPTSADCVVEISWSGVSTGTERLLWSGTMPAFPGMGYPLVPGYESVGRVVEAGEASGRKVGDWVFVPGAQCFGEVRGLFGGAAERVTVPGARLTVIDESLGEQGVLMALAATAYHALASPHAAEPDLIVGHGVLGRLLARLLAASARDHGAPAPVVWEIAPDRMGGAQGYEVIAPETDERRAYGRIFDVSGDPKLIDTLIARLAKGGELVLAGFYPGRIGFDFAPAFMKEARLRIAAEFTPADLSAVSALVSRGALDLGGLITHHRRPQEAGDAYRTAFSDAECLKMILDWRAP